MKAGEPRTYELGRVTSADPAKRRVRIEPLGRYGPLIAAQPWLRFAPAQGREMRLKVARAEYRAPADLVVADLAAGVPRDRVADLKKARVVMPREERVAAEPAHLAAADLVGCRVLDENSRERGVVTGAYAARGQDILEITDAAGLTAFPAVAGTLVSSDLGAGAVTVRDYEAHATRLGQ